MRIKWHIPVLFILVLSVYSCEEEPGNHDWDDHNPHDSIACNLRNIRKVFSFVPQNRYAYCPSVIEEGDLQHVFFCGNPRENRFVDNIYYMTIDREGQTSEPKSVLQPTDVEDFWDDQHNCDPSVVRGNFVYKGVSYNYAMFFLGSNRDFYYNEIGVAFADRLDADSWDKYDTVFLAKPWSYAGDMQINDHKAWGIGQPDAITIKPENGDVLLTYTRGDNEGTRVVYRIISGMKKVENMVIGPERSIPVQGIYQYNTTAGDYLSNVSIALDKFNDQFVIIRQMSPLSVLYPTFIHSYLEVTRIGSIDFYTGTGSWEPVVQITPEDTGYPRNHNPGLVRDEYGNTVCAADTMEVYYTTSLEEPDVAYSSGRYAEWSYTIWGARLNTE
ncbi:MAG: sugar-binding protein [Bacteroidales bacterium]|nr:sugar-binding protein [Bacteroidales bacterium]MBN2699083.1 sugar-binding protein [Bacteroidales bacterium]